MPRCIQIANSQLLSTIIVIITGKTQICHTLCVTAQRPLDQGGAEGRVIYVDTEGCFRPQKLVAIAERFQMNPEEVLTSHCYYINNNNKHS